VIRPLTAADLPALLELCAAHAEYERAPFVRDGQVLRWATSFFATAPRAWCLVVEADGRLVGYATWSHEFSTWRASEYVHVDCLYLEAAYRGRGFGRDLMLAIVERAAARGHHLEWQTPTWNVSASRFYERLGARPAAKTRYTYDPASGPPVHTR
jgi:GNAT superfamily N-acetyltransferase